MKERKLPIIFIALVFSFLVWTSVNLGETFQTTIEVPIQVENLRPDQAIAVPLPHFVSIKIQASGWQLLNTILTPQLYYSIDFSSLTKKNILFTSREVNDRIKLSSTIKIIEIFPETVIVRLDDKVSKTIPVVPVMNVSFRDGFDMVGRIKTRPDSIHIFGARSLLNSIEEWKTQPVKMQDVNAPVELSIALAETLQFEIARTVNSISITFDVQPIAEKTINDIPMEILKIPENRNIVLIPPKISIIVRSGVNNVSNLSLNDFSAYIDYKSILLDTSGFIDVTITGPDNVKIVRREPEKVQYVVRK